MRTDIFIISRDSHENPLEMIEKKTEQKVPWQNSQFCWLNLAQKVFVLKFVVAVAFSGNHAPAKNNLNFTTSSLGGR